MLASELPRTEFSDDILARLRRHYRPGVGIARAFAGLMDDLLGTEGLVVFEANEPAAKALVADIFAQELQHPGRTAGLVRRSASLLRSMGYHPQLEPRDRAVSLFHFEEDGRRSSVGPEGTDENARERSLTALHDEAIRHPERFSPNVLLRPVVQDQLFPTVCYVAGPSELVYHSQLRDVYQSFGVEPPLLHPRLSVTLIDSATLRFLGRYGLSVADLHTDPESVLRKLVEQELPAGLEEAFGELDSDLAGRASVLRSLVAQVDPTLGGALDTSVKRASEVFASLHRKVIQAAKQKNETLARQIARNQALVFPGRVPQERGLSGMYFLNRHGPACSRSSSNCRPSPPGSTTWCACDPRRGRFRQMRTTDWIVFCAVLGYVVLYGVWRARGRQSVGSFVVASRQVPWYAVGLSIMATQASAVTFISTTGQAYVDGMRFVQFYFGLPIAMLILVYTAVPLFRSANVYTAYEYLERRFDARVRALMSGIFLVQRGLALGVTLYAPAVVLTVILGWPDWVTTLLMGGMAICVHDHRRRRKRLPGPTCSRWASWSSGSPRPLRRRCCCCPITSRSAGRCRSRRPPDA